MMRTALALFLLALMDIAASAENTPGARFVQTPYEEPKAVFDFFFERPEKIGPALSWLRAFMNPLTEAPYDLAPEFMDIKVIVHGTEIVTLAKKNYEKYREVVERMRYYASLGVEFKVCALAAGDYQYATKDFQDFVQVVPSAITELAHWQRQGYALIIPQVRSKEVSVEEIR